MLTVDKKLRFWVFEVVFVTDVNRDLLELKSFLRIEFQWCADDYFVSVHSVNGEVRSNRKQRGMKVAGSTMLKKSRVQVGPKFKEGLKMNLNFHWLQVEIWWTRDSLNFILYSKNDFRFVSRREPSTLRQCGWLGYAGWLWLDLVQDILNRWRWTICRRNRRRGLPPRIE